jgi:hypothetical protein
MRSGNGKLVVTSTFPIDQDQGKSEHSSTTEESLDEQIHSTKLNNAVPPFGLWIKENFLRLLITMHGRGKNLEQDADTKQSTGSQTE